MGTAQRQPPRAPGEFRRRDEVTPRREVTLAPGATGKLSFAIGRFASTLSALTRSGVAILAALEIVERTAGNEGIAKAVREANDSVRGGETLADPLARSGEFPAMVTRMISIGERMNQTGRFRRTR